MARGSTSGARGPRAWSSPPPRGHRRVARRERVTQTEATQEDQPSGAKSRAEVATQQDGRGRSVPGQRSLREKRRRPGSRATARARPDAGRLTSGARQEPATDRTRVSGRRGEPPVWIPDFLNRRLPVLGTSPRHGGQSCRGCRSRAEAGEAGQGRCHGEDHDLCFSETRGSDVPSRGVG